MRERPDCLSPFPHGTAALSISHPLLRLWGKVPRSKSGRLWPASSPTSSRTIGTVLPGNRHTFLAHPTGGIPRGGSWTQCSHGALTRYGPSPPRSAPPKGGAGIGIPAGFRETPPEGGFAAKVVWDPQVPGTIFQEFGLPCILRPVVSCANRTQQLRGARLIRFRSSLPAESRLIFFSRPTEIFHFGTVLIGLGSEFSLWGNRQLHPGPLPPGSGGRR